MNEVHELRQRRQALETALRVLREQRERLSRGQRRALVAADGRDRSQPDAQPFADDETADDSAMTALSREIELIEDKLATKQRGGVSRSRRRIMNWLRK